MTDLLPAPRTRLMPTPHRLHCRSHKTALRRLQHRVRFTRNVPIPHHALRALLSRGSDVSAVDENGETPLSLAIVWGSVESVKLLFEHGADISTVDEEALEMCIQEEPEIAKYLAERGVEMPVNDDNDDSSTVSE